MDAQYMDEEEMQLIYNWVDEIPLSRPKKNITRDFSDGGNRLSGNSVVLMAEIVKHYIPKLVDLHNYIPAHSIAQKLYNWETLNQKILKKLGMRVNKSEVDQIVNCVPEAVERVLKLLQNKIKAYLARGRAGPSEMSRIAETTPTQGSPAVAHPIVPTLQEQNESEIIREKDEAIQELKETIEIMELKIRKLEQLVKLKDSKIQTMANKLAQLEGGANQ